MNLHLMLILGHTTGDAEQITSKAGKKFTKFTVAVNEFFSSTKEEKVFFYDVLVFGKPSERALEKVKKGDLLFVQGRPEVEAYISKKDKAPKASVTLVSEDWKLLK